MINSYLAGEITTQWAAEARERGERSRLVAVAKKAARERRRAAKTSSAGPVGYTPDAAKPAPNQKPARNAEQGTVMSC